MIRIVEGLPENVVGIVAKGRVTHEDRDNILKPLMEVSRKRNDKIRLYYELGCRFPGAAWEDLSLGMDQIPQWERVAVVSDVGWVRHMVNALRFLIPGEIRVFTTDEADEGCAWISEPPGNGLAPKPRVSASAAADRRLRQPERLPV